MIWADRIGLVWAGLWAAIYLAICIPWSDHGATWNFYFINVWPWLAVFALPPWLLLRGLHWVVAGGRRARN